MGRTLGDGGVRFVVYGDGTVVYLRFTHHPPTLIPSGIFLITRYYDGHPYLRFFLIMNRILSCCISQETDRVRSYMCTDAAESPQLTCVPPRAHHEMCCRRPDRNVHFFLPICLHDIVCFSQLEIVEPVTSLVAAIYVNSKQSNATHSSFVIDWRLFTAWQNEARGSLYWLGHKAHALHALRSAS